MRKNATKIAALALSLALTVTSVNVPTNASAASVKLNKTKATLYLNGPSKKKVSKLVVKGTNKKVTFTSSNKSVVKVNKNGKITAKATGKATITAKVNKKSYKCNVTVKKTYKPVTGITVSPKTVTLNVGKKKTLKTTVKPAKPTNKKVAYTSDKKSVATVSSAGKITAKKAGTAKITVKTKGIDKNNKHKKATVAVTVKDPNAPDASAAPSNAPDTDPSTEPSAAPSDEPTNPGVTDGKVSVELVNAFEGNSGTVLAGTSAEFKVTVKDSDGKPLANQKAVVTWEPDENNDADIVYEVPDSMLVLTTDDNGTATFVAKPKADKAIKNTERKAVGAYKYTVKVGEDVAPPDVLKVAAITYTIDQGSTSVLNLNNGTDYGNIQAGNNVDTGKNAVKRQTTDAEEKTVNYIGSQQVSVGDEHKVAFKTNVSLLIPGYSDASTPAKTYTQELNLKSEPYHTYETGSSELTSAVKEIPEDYNLSQVAYATVHFNKLNLSKHTKAVVSMILSNGTEKVVREYGYDDVTFNNNPDFSLQIPKEVIDQAKKFKIALKSEGQVDLDNNIGYDVKDIVYVYESQTKVGSTLQPLEGVEINWDIEKQVYYDDDAQIKHNTDYSTVEYYDSSETKAEDRLKGTTVTEAKVIADAIKEAVKEVEGNPEEDCYNITYSVPAFPRTGNAIIKCSDKNGNVKKIFACATINYGKNKNILYWNTAGDAKDNLLYQITEQESKLSEDAEIVDQDKESGLVVVNAKKSGVTHLIGEVTSSNPRIIEVLDAKNDHVYTSVMWNPVLAIGDSAGAGIAFAGQTAVVKAQLLDENDNPVAESGHPIKWSLPSDFDTLDIKVVEQQTSTDTKGQATLKLSASKAVELVSVNATTDKGYRVAMSLSDGLYKQGADIYWVDLHLAYTASAIKAHPGEDADTTEKGTASGKATASVGEKWEYASKVIARSKGNKEQFLDGALKDRKVAYIEGLNPTASKKASSKGDITINPDGSAEVTSKVTVAAGEGGVIFRLNSSNTPAPGTAVILDNSAKYTIIGEGSISANETLTLDYQFETKGLEMGFVTPNGNKSAKRAAVPSATPIADAQIVYLQLKDSQGNPITGLTQTDDVKQRIKVSVSGSAKVVDLVEANDGYKPNTKADQTVVSDQKWFSEDELKATASPQEAVYKELSTVKGKTEPNKDGILAIKLEDTKKEDVVVTASYGEVANGKVTTISTATQSYSFVDDEELPAFVFDTKQDNKTGNRIFFDSAKNEITVAFTNDVLASSVKQGQFKVWVNKNNTSMADASNDFKYDTTDGKELVVKNVTVDGNDKNKVIIKVEGNLTDLTKDSYFSVSIGEDPSADSTIFTFEDSQRYIFNSEDGQKLSKKTIVFPFDPYASIAELYQGEVATIFNAGKNWLLDTATADDVTEAVEALALAGIEVPTAKLENETRVYLFAIQSYISGLTSGGATLAEIQSAAKEAIKEVQEVYDGTEGSISGLGSKQLKKLGNKILKSATPAHRAIDPSLSLNNKITNATSSALGLNVTVTVTGAALGVEYENATSGAIKGDTDVKSGFTLASTEAGKLYIIYTGNELPTEAEKGKFEVKIEIASKYYVRTYILSDFEIGKTADGKCYVTGAKVKSDDIKVKLG